MTQKKMLEAITSALAHIECSKEALLRKDERKVSNSTWSAASDLELALFLFLMHQDEHENQSWKVPARSGRMKAEHLLDLVEELLKEAENNLKQKNFREAYKKAWIARGYLSRFNDS